MIHCNKLYKRFGAAEVLSNINLHIETNKLIGLVGRNGAGKTTLLKLITGCWSPTSGNVTVFSEAPFDNLFVSTNSIFIDDDIVFPEVLSLGELLQVSGDFYPNWDAALAERLFHYFEFNKEQFYYQLSKGKRSTFNALVGICSRAPLTVFDEPTTGMDRLARDDFYKALLKDYLHHPRTIIISSHHIDEVEPILEEVILIDQGKLQLQLPIDEMRHYARGIRGQADEMVSWLKDKTVLYEERVGMDELFAVVKNDEKLTEAMEGNFTVTAISVADLTNYVTNRKKGGIEHVFNETD